MKSSRHSQAEGSKFTVFLKFFFCNLCLSISLFAGQLTLDGRFEAENTFQDLSTFTALYKPGSLLGFDLQAAGRFSASLKDLEIFGYGFEATLPLFSFFQTSARISQENFLNSTTAQTHFLFLANLDVSPFSFLKLFVCGGWYKRNVRLNKPYLFPTLVGSSYTEHDFAVSFGTETSWSDNFSTLFKVATFEELSVYNLNNPFIQGQIAYLTSPNGIKWTLYSRYRLLLGFGRMDSFTAGINLAI